MRTHTNINTLPIGCYVNLFNSIIDQKPEFRWLLKFDYENEELPEVTSEQLLELTEIYKEIQYQLPDNAVNKTAITNYNRLRVLQIKLLYYQWIEKPKKTDRNKEIGLINDIGFLKMKIEQQNKGAIPKHIDLTELSLAIEVSLNIRVKQFDRSTKEFFRLLQIVEQKTKNQKQNG